MLRDWLRHSRRSSAKPAKPHIHRDRGRRGGNIDPSQLTRVLTNLVANGLRFSEQAGRPWIRLEGGVDTASERPFLNIIDEGPGVTEAQRQHLFEPFFTTEESGTGLGLYISRELCERTDSAQPPPARTPRQLLPLSFPHPQRQSVSFMSDKRALIVDDEPDILLLEMRLAHGLDTNSAANISEAHALLRKSLRPVPYRYETAGR